jgi:hypothetical protein
MMTMAAHQLGPSAGVMDGSAAAAAAYHRNPAAAAAAAAAWYIDPAAARATGYTNSAGIDHSHLGGGGGSGGGATIDTHLNHNIAPPPHAPGHPHVHPADGSFFASPEASRYYQMHQAYENAATQGITRYIYGVLECIFTAS